MDNQYPSVLPVNNIFMFVIQNIQEMEGISTDLVASLNRSNLFVTFSTIEKMRIYNISKFTERNMIMKTFSLQLSSFPGNHVDRNKLPYGPRAYICVKCSSKLNCPSKKDKKERDALSHECTTSQEFEAEVDRLVKELQQIKRQGKKFFEKELPDGFC